MVTVLKGVRGHPIIVVLTIVAAKPIRKSLCLCLRSYQNRTNDPENFQPEKGLDHTGFSLHFYITGQFSSTV